MIVVKTGKVKQRPGEISLLDVIKRAKRIKQIKIIDFKKKSKLRNKYKNIEVTARKTKKKERKLHCGVNCFRFRSIHRVRITTAGFCCLLVSV